MPPPPLCAGDVIGRYRLVERLSASHATGGAVWRAAPVASPDDATRVIKLLDDRLAFGRARAELAALRMLRLPGIPPLLDEGTFEGQPYVVTAFIPGASFPGTDGPMQWPALAPLARRLLMILASMHREGFVHCDLKLENIRVEPDGRVWLLDFGLATRRRPGEAGPGTTYFAAPEQSHLGEHAGAATDLYAFGKVLTCALTGEQLGRRHTRRVLATRADVPDHLPDVLNALAQFHPADRPRCADDVWRMLDAGAAPERLPRVAALADVDAPAPLEPLFAGPEPIFHLQSSAARALFDRTDGRAALMQAELDVWVGSGLALPDGDRLIVERDDLRRIEQGLLLGRPTDPAVLPGSLEEQVVLAIELAWPWSTIELLQVLVSHPIAAVLDTLEARGAIVRLRDGRYRACFAPPAADEETLRAVHAALAAHLPPEAAASRRVYHLVRAAREADAITRAVEAATDALGVGCAAEAWELMDDIAFLARVHADAPTWRRICVLWTCAAFYLQHERDFYPVLVGMGDRPEDDIAALLEARAGAHTPPSLPPRYPEPELEMWRRLAEMRRTGTVEVAPDDHPTLIGQSLMMQASARYAAGDWTAAARLRLAAADRLVGSYRYAALIDAASALLPAFEFDRAARIVADLLPELRAQRNSYLEGRAIWLTRDIAHRRGHPQAAAPDWEAAVVRLGNHGLVAVACLTEAAIAWHGDRFADCERLAALAADAWDGLPNGYWPATLCRCLGSAAGGKPLEAPPSIDAILEVPVPGAAFQFLGLLAAAGHDLPPIAEVFEATIPPGPTTVRHAVLSVEDARRFVPI